MKKYYSLTVENQEATVQIYGDITSGPWLESDVSSYILSKEIENLDVDIIHVYINSYGGEVSEGIAIYNTLKRHKAKIKTYCDGMACSIASVIFMAGDERIMADASLLMIHNPWVMVKGDANALRKEAEDLDTIAQMSIKAYLSKITIEEAELRTMMDEETWITPEDALEKGFATEIVAYDQSGKTSQSARGKVIQDILRYNKPRAMRDTEAENLANIVIAKWKDYLQGKLQELEGQKEHNKIMNLLKANQKGGAK